MKIFQFFETFVLFFLIGSTLSASLPKQNKNNLKKIGDKKTFLLTEMIKNLKNVYNKEGGIYPRDWLTDLISQLLGISVSDLLQLINSTLLGMDALLEAAVSELEKIIQAVNPEAQKELQNVIDVALGEVLEIMAPILSQMGEVLPAITKEMQPRDLISDIILAILGITLEELLITVTDALANLNTILNQTLQSLHEVAKNVNPDASEDIKSVSDLLVDDAKQLLSPLLDMLRQIFPEKVSGCILTSEQRKEYHFRNSGSCQQGL